MNTWELILITLICIGSLYILTRLVLILIIVTVVACIVLGVRAINKCADLKETANRIRNINQEKNQNED